MLTFLTPRLPDLEEKVILGVVDAADLLHLVLLVIVFISKGCSQCQPEDQNNGNIF